METITFTGQVFQYLVTGIAIGSIYAMVAVGFNIIYNVTEIINFAQGEFVMLGGLIMVFLHVAMGLPLILALSGHSYPCYPGGDIAGQIGHQPDPPAHGIKPDNCNHCCVYLDQGNGHVYLGQRSF